MNKPSTAPKDEHANQKTKPKSSFTYSAERVVGNGSFGIVYQAHIVETGEAVAIKKVYQDKRYKNRELHIMKSLSHPNIIPLKNAFYTKGDKPDEIYLNLVMDYIPETSYRLLKNCIKQKQQMPLIQIKLYIYQLLRALNYLHSKGYAHRDIKPQNLLIDTNDNHHLYLCDFGSAKTLASSSKNVSYICSRYYRAPELIFGATEYTTSIDIWSVGCVLFELLVGKPLFPGESGVDQLVEIIKILGTPSKDHIKAMNTTYNDSKFPQVRPQQWNKVLKERMVPDAIDLLSKILVYSPKERPSAAELLSFGFFDELRLQNTKFNGNALPELFNFEVSEIPDIRLLNKLVPSWTRKKKEH